MKRQAIAALLAAATGLPAYAEQFAVRLDTPYQGASAGLISSLKITEIESFSANGANYVILDAPDEAYVEAFIFAIRRDALELNRLEANWTSPAFASLPLQQRLEFLLPVRCEFCIG